MFRIAKNLVKTLEQSVTETFSQDSLQIDSFFQSIPPNLIVSQFDQSNNNDVDINTINNSLSGLRVVYVDEFNLQLHSFFDYIIGINDDPLPVIKNIHNFSYPDYNAIISILNNIIINNKDSNGNAMIKLNIWSAKGGVFRDEYLTLKEKDENELDDVSLNQSKINNVNNNSDNNNNNNNTINNTSNSDSPRIFQKLGFKVQWSPLIASTFTYHILQLNIPNGPAQQGGLIPDEDYIIGCQDGLLATGGNELLSDVVRSRTNNNLILYVYNKMSDSIRPITVSVGPDGRLGCNIGYGFLHRIPTVRSTTNYNKNNDKPHNSINNDSMVNNAPSAYSEATFIPNTVNTNNPEIMTQPVLTPSAAGHSGPSDVVTQSSEQMIAPPLSDALPPSSSKKKKKPIKKNAMMSEYFNEGKDPHTANKNTEQVPPPPTKNDTKQ